MKMPADWRQMLSRDTVPLEDFGTSLITFFPDCGPAPVTNQIVASGISPDRDLDHVYDWIGSLKSFPIEPLEETLMIIHWVKGCYWSINGNRYISPDRK